MLPAVCIRACYIGFCHSRSTCRYEAFVYECVIKTPSPVVLTIATAGKESVVVTSVGGVKMTICVDQIQTLLHFFESSSFPWFETRPVYAIRV